MPRARDLDAVTIDGAGTLLELIDPVPALRAALAAHGVETEPEAVAGAFAAEVAWYLPRSHTGRDAATLAGLRRAAAAVFLDALGAELEPEAFAPSFVGALRFEPIAGAAHAVKALAGAGLALACVANWDVGLGEHLERAGLAASFAAVISSAEAGAAKPDPAIFAYALARLGVRPERTLHIGDSEADREGARAAGLAFAEVPLGRLPARLGLT
jgi:putative hydrolase of the HAD superfamily